MSIGKRFLELARSNLNDLMDKLRDVRGWGEDDEESRREVDEAVGHSAPRPEPGSAQNASQSRAGRRRSSRAASQDPFIAEAERELDEALRGYQDSAPRARPRPQVADT